MNRTARLTCAAIALPILAGCASSQQTTQPSIVAESSPQPATPVTPVQNEFHAPTDAAEIPMPVLAIEPREDVLITSGRRPSLLGLYGEVADDSETGGPFDGSNNIAQISTVNEGACFDPTIDRTGKFMVFSSTMHRRTADIYMQNVPGKTVTQLTADPGDDVMPSISPDGQRIAFASNRGGNWDIYAMSIEGGQPMQITSGPEHELHPSWSPDGTRLVYCRLGAQSGRWELWVVDVKSPGVRQFLDYGLHPKWSPDVARPKILFQRARERGSRFFGIWTIDYVNGEAMHPTEIVSASNAAIINPAWSPDGKRIVFVTVVEPDVRDSVPVKQSDIWIVNLDGTGRTNLTNGRFANFQPAWSPDGRVFFVSNRSGTDNIWAVATARAIEAQPGEPGAGSSSTVATATDE